jgi:hypothetical protein
MKLRLSRPPPLAARAARAGRDVFVALAFKALLLLLLYGLFFGPSHRTPSDARSTAAALLGTPHPEEIR